MPDPAPDAPPPENLVREPQQDRSRRTLERMLEAAVALLEDGGVDALTVTGVAQRAPASVGSFYARFAGKEDLVRYLGERSMVEALEEWGDDGANDVQDAVEALERLAGSYESGPARRLVLLDGQDDPLPRRLRRFEDAVARILAPLLDPDAPEARSTFHRAVALVAAVRELTLRGPAGGHGDEPGDRTLSPSVVARLLVPLIGGMPAPVAAPEPAAPAGEREPAVSSVEEEAAAPEPEASHAEPEPGDAPEASADEDEEGEDVDLFDVWG